jgi:hypothetical protein
MRDIKRVEMFKNWRIFIPKEKRDEVCPRVSAELVAKKNQEREKKRNKVHIDRINKGVAACLDRPGLTAPLTMCIILLCTWLGMQHPRHS